MLYDCLSSADSIICRSVISCAQEVTTCYTRGINQIGDVVWSQPPETGPVISVMVGLNVSGVLHYLGLCDISGWSVVMSWLCDLFTVVLGSEQMHCLSNKTHFLGSESDHTLHFLHFYRIIISGCGEQ